MRFNMNIIIGYPLLCLVLVDATQRHLRGFEDEDNFFQLLQEADGHEQQQQQQLQSPVDDRALQFILQNGDTFGQEGCRKADPDKVCDGPDDKIVCAGRCPFRNACEARGALYLPRRDCQVDALFNAPTFNNIGGPCPTAGTGELCLDLNDPQICGNCEYRNQCFAESAGFFPKRQCEPKEPPPPVDEDFINAALLASCPGPDPSFLCFLSTPVLCGPENCRYESACFARAAGINPDEFCRFTQRDQTECPPPSFLASLCNVPVAPKACGPLQCVYKSQCAASNTGFSPDVCGPVPSPTPTSRPTAAPFAPPPEPTNAPTPKPCVATECPKPLEQVDGSICERKLAVKCNCCSYDNECVAAAAGFNPQLECQVRGTGGSTTQEPAEVLPDFAPGECPPLSTKIPCTGDKGGINEVKCRGCVYGNRCQAAGAGFSGNICNLVNAPATPAPIAPTTPRPSPLPTQPQPTAVPTKTPCPKRTGPVCFSSTAKVPVVCDGDCEYASLCDAGKAGFVETQCILEEVETTNSNPTPSFFSSLGGFGSGPAPPSSPTPSFGSQFPAPAPGPSPSFTTTFGSSFPGFGSFTRGPDTVDTTPSQSNPFGNLFGFGTTPAAAPGPAPATSPNPFFGLPGF